MGSMEMMPEERPGDPTIATAERVGGGMARGGVSRLGRGARENSNRERS
jgi:hypothetical protein